LIVTATPSRIRAIATSLRSVLTQISIRIYP
jgi:hypothetical protein